MKKFFTAMVSAALCLTMAAGMCACSPKGGDNTLTVWVSNPLKPDYESILSLAGGGQNKMALYTKKVVESFEEAHPGVTVKLENRGWSDSLNSQVMSAARSNTLPDLMMGEMYMPIYMQEGILRPLDLGDYESVLSAGVVETVKKDGKIYGAPFSTGVIALQYNAEVLQDAGIPEEDWIPETWTDLLDNAQKVAKVNTVGSGSDQSIVTAGYLVNNVAGISGAFRALPYVRQAGGDYLTNGQPSFDSEGAVSAYTLLRSLAATTVTGSLGITAEDQLHNLFIKGAAAYQLDGPWTLAEAEGNNFRTCPIPKPAAGSDTSQNAYVGNLIMAMTKNVKNENLANAFVKHLLSDEMQWELFVADSRIPTNMQFLREKYNDMVAERPYFKTYLDVMLNDEFAGGLPTFSRNSTRIWETWGSFYNKVLTGEGEIAALAQDFNAQIKNLI